MQYRGRAKSRIRQSNILRFCDNLMNTLVRAIECFILSVVLMKPHVVSAQQESFAYNFSKSVAANTRANLYQLDAASLKQSRRQGLRHLLSDPETNLSVAFPIDGLNSLFKIGNRVPFDFASLNSKRFGSTWQEVFDAIGLVPYPPVEGKGPYFVPFPPEGRPAFPIGASIQRNKDGVDVYTQSCASCHCRNLFGRPVLGAGSLQPQSQAFLNHATIVTKVPAQVVFHAVQRDEKSYRAFRSAQENLAFHGIKDPVAMGLDTPHATTALSLMMRERDEYATKSHQLRKKPRISPLTTWPSEVKVPPLWLAKYKNRFFVDGSIHGNVVLSNLLWIKISQGIDLKEFERWVLANDDIVRDMTVAVFATESPTWSDFFDVSQADLTQAKSGEVHFNSLCARCHGTYEKSWHHPNADSLSLARQFETLNVRYPTETRLENVGTDPRRAAVTAMMQADINRLHFTKRFDIAMKTPPAGSYVPQPLVGIWARWPYMHNGSIPTLADVLRPAVERPQRFYVAPAIERRDFDSDAIGFPAMNRVQSKWKSADRLFDTSIPGLSNQGHDEGIFILDGDNIMTKSMREELLAFLKSL